MRGFDEVLDDLAEKWDNLNDVERNAVATAMAGKLVPVYIVMDIQCTHLIAGKTLEFSTTIMKKFVMTVW